MHRPAGDILRTIDRKDFEDIYMKADICLRARLVILQIIPLLIKRINI